VLFRSPQNPKTPKPLIIHQSIDIYIIYEYNGAETKLIL
jgi:hypothetical protein